MIIFVTGHAFAQDDLNYGMCRFDFRNFEKSNFTFYSLDSMPQAVVESINLQIIIKNRCYSNCISFIKGQKIEKGSKYLFPNFKKYHNKRLNDSLNFIYNLPDYEFIFRFYTPQIEQEYFFNVYTDFKGAIIGEIHFPINTEKACNLIGISEALSIVEKKWKNRDDQIKIRFVYYSKKKCFVWSLSQLIESKKNGDVGTVQSFIVKAEDGTILKNYLTKLIDE